MTSTKHANYLPALGAHQRADGGEELQARLVKPRSLARRQADALERRCPLFRTLHLQLDELHLQLDELVDSWRELAGTVAERAVTIGFWPDGQSSTVAADSALGSVERGELESRVVVRELTRRVADVAERVRNRMDRLGELDAASRDVVIEVSRALEQQLWMIRAQFGTAQQR